MLTITTEQVLALASDASSAQAGRKLASPQHWQTLGQSAQALWGECKGSALYQVRVDLSSMSVKCSCPSRKFPCKHGVALMLLAAATPDALTESEPPEWVASWLAKRATTAAAKESKASAASGTAQESPATRANAPAASAAAKRVARRERLVAEGIDMLDLWLNDLMRAGLGRLEAQPASFWRDQAARLVDAQAPGLAGRIRAMAGVVGAAGPWPQRLLDMLGQTALLTQAYRQQDTLDSALREDVRQLVGWTVPADEVDARGEVARDRWITIGQWVSETDGERLRTQRTWLLGQRSRRPAMVMQFSVNSRFETAFLPGVVFDAELRFWPGAYPIRAKVASQAETPMEPVLRERPPGHETIEAFLTTWAEAIGHQPWLDRLGCALLDVTPIPSREDDWLIADRTGAALPLASGDYWRLLAISGGKPVDLMGEWNGDYLLPLGVFAEGAYMPLWGINA